MNAEVSIIVATYRREEVLKRALRSLAEQTYKNIEIILVDDNDNLEWNEKVSKIVEAFQKTNPGVKLKYLENHPNLGSAKARNAGIELATGEYITFLDDDDIYLPNKVKEQVAVMQESNADFSVTDLELYYDDGKLSERRVRTFIKNTDKKSLLRYHLMYHITGTDTMMFKRKYILTIGGFAPIDVGDEFYLMHRAINGQGKFVYLNKCDVKAYVHRGEGGLSSGQQKIDGENQLFNYKKNYFHELDVKSKRYINMRHYAVLAFAGLRKSDYVYAFKNMVLSFLYAPMQCMGLYLNRKR